MNKVRRRLHKLLPYAECVVRNRFARASITAPGGPIVSLTTHGARLGLVYLAIESIVRGPAKPQRCILWIDEAEAARPRGPQLARLVRRGLEIRTSPNYGPHKKYYPYVAETTEFTSPLVIADDDVFYERDWLARLVAAYAEHPGVVSAHRAHRIALAGERLAPYLTWRLASDTSATLLNLATGVGGVIFPPGVLRELKAAGTAFAARCPRADDVWLHVNAMRAGFTTRQIAPTPSTLAIIPGTQTTSLFTTNAYENDAQIAATYEAADIARLAICAKDDAGNP